MTEYRLSKFLFCFNGNNPTSKCCCGCTLKTGVWILAVLGLVASIFSILDSVFAPVKSINVYFTLVSSLLLLAVNVLLIAALSSVKAIYGYWAYMLNAVYFIINTILYVVYIILLGVYGNKMIGNIRQNQPSMKNLSNGAIIAIISIVIIIIILISLYFLWVIYSFAKHLCDGNVTAIETGSNLTQNLNQVNHFSNNQTSNSQYQPPSNHV